MVQWDGSEQTRDADLIQRPQETEIIIFGSNVRPHVFPEIVLEL